MARRKKPDRVSPFKELGASSAKHARSILYEDFLPKMRGSYALRKYREMRDNDATVGSILNAMDMVMRSVRWNVEAADDTPAAVEAKEFVESVFDDMSSTFEDFISGALSCLPYGFSYFEVVYKRRGGPDKSAEQRSKFTDGRIGIRKLAPRPQWTLEYFDTDEDGGVLGMVQNASYGGAYIPIEKSLLIRTTAAEAQPTGRSVLRNAYVPYWYLSNIQNVEAIAIEREMNGLPVGRIPGEYFDADADADQKAFKSAFEAILRDVKLNEQGFVLLPSDMQPNDDGTLSNHPLIGFELLTSTGKRAIDTNPVILRYQREIARLVLADFLMLGSTDSGSFSMSADKSKLFRISLNGYLGSIAGVLNRHLLPRLWKVNGMPYDVMPELQPEDANTADLEALGNYIQKLAGAGAPLFPDVPLENALRSAADLPEVDPDRDDMEAMGLPGQPQPQQPAPANPGGKAPTDQQAEDMIDDGA